MNDVPKNNNLNKLQVALVYDKVNTFGGAERVLFALHTLFPQAPLYTSVYHSKTAQWASIFPQIIPSFLQNFPFASNHIQLYTAFMPIAFESFNFDQYHLVITVTSGEAKSIITKPNTLHLCYLLTPTRYLWPDPGYQSYRFNILNHPIHLIKAPFLHYLKIWDFAAAQRPDYIATISKNSQSRIQKYYQGNSIVIFPPVNADFFKPKTNPRLPIANNYFLLVSRLASYKKVDLAIQTFNHLKYKLIIAGTGPEFNRLKSLAKPNITLLGHTSEKQLLELYQNCQALIMPQEEDFGLVALEAQACGKPVIAFNRGGATETIINHKTGIFFNYQSTTSLLAALNKFAKHKFKAKDCRQQALKFSLDNFQTQIKQWINTQWQTHQAIEKTFRN